MKNNILNKQGLENVLRSHWSEFTRRNELMLFTLESARDADYNISDEETDIPQQLKISITKVSLSHSGFEIWIEFIVPRNDGVAIGTHVCFLSLNGNLELVKSYGTQFNHTTSRDRTSVPSSSSISSS